VLPKTKFTKVAKFARVVLCVRVEIYIFSKFDSYHKFLNGSFYERTWHL